MLEAVIAAAVAGAVGFLSARSLYRAHPNVHEECSGGCAQCTCKRDS